MYRFDQYLVISNETPSQGGGGGGILLSNDHNVMCHPLGCGYQAGSV